MARLRFAECTFDSRAHGLRRAGREVHLSNKAFLLLEMLLDRRPQVLSHAELRDSLWPGTFVSYSSLAGLISEVRRAIGDHTRPPRLVRTVHGLGYSFIAEAEGTPEPARVEVASPYRLRWRSRELPLLQGQNLVGRDPECDVQIGSSRVSRRHARITINGREAILDDLGSKNGTFVGGRPVTAPTALRDGDVILLGHESVVFAAVGGTATTETDEG
jgi:DNA-binding winged helix-turn-helix (wHTH) protein